MREHALSRLLLLLAAAAFRLLLALALGSVALNWGAAWRVDDGGIARSLLLELRLPRALAAFAVGALLALSGCLMQVLLRNPLADPYILGVSGGAAVGGLSVIAAGAAGSLLPIGAFGGAFGSILLVFALAGSDRSHAQTRLLLTGVVIAAGWGAVTALLLALSPDTQLRGMVFWLLGDLSAGGMPFLAVATLGLALALTLPRAPALNVLAQGDLTAQALGVPVVSLRRLLYFVASGCAAMAVATAGTIGFVGLLAPHLARLVLGNDQRILLPGSALAGGALLTLADTVARSVIAPTQLPVGAVTALLGVPLFLYLLSRR
jgi:iron complex transport system permease protein